MFIFYLPFILITSMLFTRLSHPLSMGLTLFIQTIFICISSGLSNLSFWFSYILFIIFLGGMLVLFIYVASLASNEIFNLSPNFLFLTILFTLFMILTIITLADPMMISTKLKIASSSLMTFYKLDYTSLLVSTIYSPSSMFFTLFLIIYLLLTLFVVVKIINIYSSPMRTNN
uniref:NADH-ubiquinone oxidoreductase chain 6 n=1 Tax=Cambaroides japonicus TaxID=119070 RepID=A0A1L6V0C6_9EUCA|nr:NADH dehydrogenase subunit 6 [Cambaroides japonicus]APS87242.1 NADH dehydrogenase subunit 6 [Cambaroides japonicus]